KDHDRLDIQLVHECDSVFGIHTAPNTTRVVQMLVDIEYRKLRPPYLRGFHMQHRFGLKVAKQESLLFLGIWVCLIADLGGGQDRNHKKESEKTASSSQGSSVGLSPSASLTRNQTLIIVSAKGSSCKARNAKMAESTNPAALAIVSDQALASATQNL